MMSPIVYLTAASGSSGEKLATPPFWVTQRLPSGPVVIPTGLVTFGRVELGDVAVRRDPGDVVGLVEGHPDVAVGALGQLVVGADAGDVELAVDFGAAAAGEAAKAARPRTAQSAARARVRNERGLVEMSGVVVFMGQASPRA